MLLTVVYTCGIIKTDSGHANVTDRTGHMVRIITIDIDDYKYSIEKVPPLSAPLSDGEAVGRVSYESSTIYISDALEGIRLKEVLTHEITHAYLHRFRLRKDTYTEEDVCELFALLTFRVAKCVAEAIINFRIATTLEKINIDGASRKERITNGK